MSKVISQYYNIIRRVIKVNKSKKQLKCGKMKRFNLIVMNKKGVLQIIQEEKIEFIIFQFTDLFGRNKSITIPSGKLKGVIDGSEESCLKPDLETFVIIPKSNPSMPACASFICDVYTFLKTPYCGDPRYILKEQIKSAKKLGYELIVGVEIEFTLFHRGKNDSAIFLDDKSDFLDESVSSGSDIRLKIANTAKLYGIEIEEMHHEAASCKHEIVLRHGNVLRVADNIIMLKKIIQDVAYREGYIASFMAKPLANKNIRNSMHIHQNLVKNGRNIFFDKEGKEILSQTALYYMGGILKYTKEMCIITNPTVNSYKRMLYKNPVRISWGYDNRSALIRVPAISENRDKAMRIELRSPDVMSNPYLVFASTLCAGLLGIKEEIIPNLPMNKKPSEYTSEELELYELFPVNLSIALLNAKNSKFLRKVLGEKAFHEYYDNKHKEWNEYDMYVTDWEREKYI